LRCRFGVLRGQLVDGGLQVLGREDGAEPVDLVLERVLAQVHVSRVLDLQATAYTARAWTRTGYPTNDFTWARHRRSSALTMPSPWQRATSSLL
jgi:hypothetical protein